MDFDEILESIDPDGEWESDGFGFDSILIHSECGSRIEQDCPKCPECGTRNPIYALM